MSPRGALRGNGLWIITLCALAALRVFIYSAAFPFFNNVDEQAHFDLVLKYGAGHIPHSLEPYSPDSARYIAHYGSPEYFGKKAEFLENRLPQPLWKQPDLVMQDELDRGRALWVSLVNHESSEPPLYYLVAGIWSDLGSLFGFRGGWFLYWIRFLNVVLVVALVYVAYLAAKSIFPDNRFITLGVPLVVAFLPQDSYYSIQGDVLSPLCFGIAFYNLHLFLRYDVPTPQLAVLAGLTVAATLLAKTCNLPLLLVVGVVVLLKIRRLSQSRKLSEAALPISEFALCALTPVIVWFLWNLSNYGDLTASSSKIRVLGWTAKPISGWFHHPMFTPRGAWTFWSELLASFWRGEFVWLSSRLAMPVADAFYCVSSLIFVAWAVIGIRGETDLLKRRTLWLAFWSFVSLVLFMVWISIGFDFGKCASPSQEHPFSTSGRLLSAALIPFSLLYCFGLERALSWIKGARWPLSVLIALMLLVTASEIVINLPAFHSNYNLFHL